MQDNVLDYPFVFVVIYLQPSHSYSWHENKTWSSLTFYLGLSSRRISLNINCYLFLLFKNSFPSRLSQTLLVKRKRVEDLPGGPGVKNLPCNAENRVSVLVKWESTYLGATDSMCHYYWALRTTKDLAAATKTHIMHARAKLLQTCLTLCNSMDHSTPGSFVHGILQARILEWVAVSSSRGSSQWRNWAHISYVSCIDRWVLNG